jgi:nucleotide-binding universal stress UspA family protein
MALILVATDFSACSRTAVALAAALARRRRAWLLLLHAVQAPPVGFPTLPASALSWEAELRTAAEIELRRLASDVCQSGIEVEARVDVGPPARTILDTAADTQADLIVMGTHGRQGAAHLFLGSVAEHVVRRTLVPVLVTRDGPLVIPRWEGRQTLELSVTMDGSTASAAALTWAAAFARPNPRQLTLTRVYSPREEAIRYGLDQPWGELPREADLVPLLERDLRSRAADLIGDVPLRLRFCAAGHDAEEVLTQDASAVGADALVVGLSRQRARAAFSTGAILRRSSVPVFCVPEAAVPARPRLPEVSSILVAADLSDASEAVARSAYGLLRQTGGRIELVMINVLGPADGSGGVPLVPSLGIDERKSLEAQLRALIPAEAALAGVTTNVSVLDARVAAEGILAAAERLDVDLVAVGSHGRSGVGRALLGSVAEDVARRSSRPVLIVGARASETR